MEAFSVKYWINVKNYCEIKKKRIEIGQKREKLISFWAIVFQKLVISIHLNNTINHHIDFETYTYIGIFFDRNVAYNMIILLSMN